MGMVPAADWAATLEIKELYCAWKNLAVLN